MLAYVIIYRGNVKVIIVRNVLHFLLHQQAPADIGEKDEAEGPETLEEDASYMV
eukprot:CAMPEP_0182551146 /NCGR_PEP_ID=MMETSP1323-20130603/43844_1 /TAXON_ID=236787 /ORGANISM="Florenciella parvula, Strain RCC1693" /LENGTH=53 /DNA_ID=CAMNT_0024762727 /DNA_START=87 /DNA_END=248 /DNA_ORIENTATION=+